MIEVAPAGTITIRGRAGIVTVIASKPGAVTVVTVGLLGITVIVTTFVEPGATVTTLGIRVTVTVDP